MSPRTLIVTLASLFAGAVAGAAGVAWFVTDMSARLVAGAWQDNAVARLADTTLLLRLLEDGKTDALRNVLVGRAQADSITFAGGLPPGSNPVQLRDQVRMLEGIASIQADDSDIGKAAAAARRRILQE